MVHEASINSFQSYAYLFRKYVEECIAETANYVSKRKKTGNGNGNFYRGKRNYFFL